MKIDLHCHTRFSDGSVRIKEVMELAHRQNIQVLSVTDHDTFAGADAAESLCAESGIEILPGVEISAFDYDRGRKVHILCYHPFRRDALAAMLQTTCENRIKAMQAVLPVITALYPMPEEMVWNHAAGSTAIFKQHVMHALMDAGYADSLFGEVFQKLFGREGVAKTRVKYPDIRQVLGAVRAAGGIAVMAHPGEYKSLALLEELFAENLLQGAELTHPKNSPEDQKIIRKLCENYGKIITGGTDFHGWYAGRSQPIGSFLTQENEYKKLKKLTERNLES